jgi:hypothetical protein
MKTLLYLFIFVITVSCLPAQITTPPKSLGLDPFYKKYIDANGIPVISSDKVPDQALYKVKELVLHMTSFRDDVRVMFIKNKGRVGIMAKTEKTLDMPEYRDLQEVFPDTDWNTRGRGFGASKERPLSSCAEENILCYTEDVYREEDIFIHEFGHSLAGLGIRYIEPGFDAELKSIYHQAMEEGLWKNTYAATNQDEYWAEGVQDWFNTNIERGTTDGIHNYVNTRAELKAYDPRLHELISRYFTEDEENLSCHKVVNRFTMDNSITVTNETVELDPKAFYRLETMFTKDLAMTVDTDNKSLKMSEYTGDNKQLWQFNPDGTGYYRITNAALGTSFSFDLLNNEDRSPVIAATGNYSGQYWKIVPEKWGWLRLQTMFTGTERSLDIDGSTGQKVLMSPKGDYSGQYWRIIRVK